MTLTVQWLTLMMMLAAGLGMGVVFDGYRVVSNELRFPRWWLPFLDIIYWIAAAAVVFRMLYASNNGEVRAYVFVGLALGVLFYYWLFAKLVVKSVRWLIQAIRAMIRFTLKALELIIVKPLLFMYNVLKFALGIGTAFSIFMFKLVVQLVRPIWKLLQWLTGPLWRPLLRWLSPKWDKCKQMPIWHKLSRIWERSKSSMSKASKWMNWLRRR